MRTASKFGLSLALLATVAVTTAAWCDVVISEFRTRGPAGGNDEFVEIWNNSPSSADISGWKLNGSNNAGTITTRATVPAGVVLASGCYYLFTNSATGGYSGAVAGDQTYATGFTDDGGLAILNAASVIQDMAGMSATSAYKEGTTLAPTGSNLNQAYERKPGGAGGNSLDTNDNANDFLYKTSSSPQNRQSVCLGAVPAASPTWGSLKVMYR